MKPHESLHHQDIKDVGPDILEQRSEFLFNPSREILPTDLEQMKEYLSDPEVEMGWERRADVLIALRRFDPHYSVPEFTEQEHQSIKEDFRTDYELAYPLKLLHTYYQLRQLKPGFTLGFQIGADDLEYFRRAIDHDRRYGVWKYYDFDILGLQELDPTFNVQDEVPPREIAIIRGVLRSCQDGSGSRKWCHFTRIAKVLCTFDPDFDPASAIPPEAREAILEELRRCRAEKDWSDFSLLICDLDAIDQKLRGNQPENPSHSSLPITKKY